MSTPASRPLPSHPIAGSQFDIPIEVKYIDGRYEKLNVRIRRVNTGFFRISSAVHMRPGRRLAVFYCGNRIEGTVLYSNKSDDGQFSVGINRSVADSQPRREARLPMNVNAQLSRPGAVSQMRVKVVDISRSGIGFSSSVEIPAGLPVCLEFDDHLVFAEVRHCTLSSGTYRVGCAVEDFIRIEPTIGAPARRKSVWAKLRTVFSRKPRLFETITLPGAFANR